MNRTSICTCGSWPRLRRNQTCAAAYCTTSIGVCSGLLQNTHYSLSSAWTSSLSSQNKWSSRSPMPQRRVYHSMAAVQRKLYVLGGNDLDYNNDRILVRHIDSYSIDADQWTRCSFNMLTGQNESGVAVHNGRIYLVGGYSIWTNEPLACIQVLDVSKEGKEEVFYGPTLPFASNGIAACFLPAPYFTCPNLQTLQVPHHRIGTMWHIPCASQNQKWRGKTSNPGHRRVPLGQWEESMHCCFTITHLS